MSHRNFFRSGHWPTLLAAFVYFDMSFMVWVLIGALATTLTPELGLSDYETGLLVATPILGGALLRVPLGLVAERIGGRRAGILGLSLTLAPLVLGWLVVDSFAGLLGVGLLLGIAGASFAVALPLVSRWYPAEQQGLVLGITGAGNSGTVLAAFIAPRLCEVVGWQGVFGAAAAVIAATLLFFALLAKDSPRRSAPSNASAYLSVLGERDAWWLAAFYSVTFGGFVGLASFLGVYFHQEYGVSRVAAGSLSAVCVVAGSFLRPVGGFLADRFGGVRVLTALYFLAGVFLSAVATTPPVAAATMCFFVAMGLLGMGNGAVFQLVPQRFGRDIGVVTGLVGAAGGVGGFLLPVLLGAAKQLTGNFGTGLVVFAVAAFASALALLPIGRAWQAVARSSRLAPDLVSELVPVRVPVTSRER